MIVVGTGLRLTTSIVSTPRQLTLELADPPQPSLANFVVGRNAEVVAALHAMADGSGEQFMYLYGETGSGRSHLVHALDAAPQRGVLRFKPGTPLYVVDDIDQLNESNQQQLFVLLNEIRADGNARFVGAGNAAPKHLTLRDDIRTRLAWGLVYQVHALSDVEKAQALTAHAAARGVALSVEVIDYLLTHMPRDMRTLVAIVDALDDYALSEKRVVTLPLVRLWADGGRPLGEP